jgi:putative ABC transport system substrate-binding protein
MSKALSFFGEKQVGISTLMGACYAVPTIGIVVPLAHPAMQEIVQGFKAELHQAYPHPVNVVVKNAQHDLMIQRMIIQQMKGNHTTIIEPIGVDAFEMTLASVKNKPVLGIAAEMSNEQRLAMKPPYATSVLDEVEPKMQLTYVKQLMPSLHEITLVHSADDKTLQEVHSFKQAASSLGIQVQDLTVPTAPDMMTVSQHLDKHTQAVFVLKDHLIVSQMPVLVKQVSLRTIPIIASDDGSIKQGAAMAVGVPEKDIGIAAADITAAVLKGKSMGDIPVKKLSQYKVFVNTDTLATQGLTLKDIQSVSQQFHYPVVKMHTVMRSS